MLITCEGNQTASQLRERGKYDWPNDWITDVRFPLSKHPLVQRTLELIGFDHDVTSPEVLTEFSHRGVERPTYGDCLYFGVQHPEVQRRYPVVFLHEPVRAPSGGLSVLVLGSYVGDRGLYLEDFDGEWCQGFVFAGVRKVT